MCKVFPPSLGETGLRWFDRLPTRSIRGWKQLSEEFLARFVSNTKIPKEPDTLFGLRKEQEETLRSYARRYWEEYNDLEENVCSEQMVILSFKHGLRPESRLRQSLTKRPATTLKDLLARIEQYARLEDNQIPIEVASTEQTARYKKRTNREEHRGIAVNEVDKSKSHKAIMTVFKEPIYRILEKIKREPFFVWPPKMLGDPARHNQKLRCTYYQDRGHMTQNCRALKQHLEDLVAAGHLRDYIDQDKKVTEPGNLPPEPTIKHPPRLIINVIHETTTQEGSRLKGAIYHISPLFSSPTKQVGVLSFLFLNNDSHSLIFNLCGFDLCLHHRLSQLGCSCCGLAFFLLKLAFKNVESFHDVVVMTADLGNHSCRLTKITKQRHD
ncbi:uncharacterized protein LOC114271902 [Camellia sinensis]|uniref:uncharacterized protein LOC114271902 n=1 Tax=Camellia sinensis TaxID=4442 RepID=UPI00103647EC|nr:uncharacterized protein LOC114271902 [Camellia sinensis]